MNKKADRQRILDKQKAWSRAYTVQGRMAAYCSVAILPFSRKEDLWLFLLAALFTCSIIFFCEKNGLREKFVFVLIGAIVSSTFIVLVISNFLIQLILLLIFGWVILGTFYYYESEMQTPTESVDKV